MGTYDNSVLTDTKKLLGLAEDDTTFDADVIMHVNSAFGTLSQLGIGPEGGMEIEDTDAKWVDFLLTDLQLSPVKSYVFLRVRLLFDPPDNSWTATAFQKQVEELEWRLNVVREDTIPIPDEPDPDEEFEVYLDGGEI